MKLGILAGKNFTKFQQNVLKPILDDQNIEIRLIVIDSSPSLSLSKALRKNLKRGRGGYIFVMAFNAFFSKQKTESESTIQFCKKYNFPYIASEKIHSEKTVEIIKKNGLDAMILLGAKGIISEPLISLCPSGILSYHHGNMRKYRGMPPAFWELFNEEKEMGITVQRIAKKLDCGFPIEEKNIPIRHLDTLKSLTERAYTESENMMHKALKKISTPNFIYKPIDEIGKVYTLPNLRQWLLFNIKIFFRQASYVCQKISSK